MVQILSDEANEQLKHSRARIMIQSADTSEFPPKSQDF
jgi:hypothetical protein